ncbi:unnamed protein product [Rhizophagus irregularis]|nr:unnamed protein product [Rhizophagus irregularis]
MQEVVQGTVSSFGTKLAFGLGILLRKGPRFGLDYERGHIFLVLGLQRLLFAAIGYWTSEWANKMQLLG